MGAGIDAGAVDPRRGRDHAPQPRVLREQLAVAGRTGLHPRWSVHGHQVALITENDVGQQLLEGVLGLLLMRANRYSRPVE